ncbi:MAG: cadherin repeat domain-containing protein [Psychrobium sp.]
MLKTKPSIIASAVLLSLGLSACGGSSNSSTPAPTPTPTNSVPTAIALSATEVAENAVAATVGKLTTTDADSGDTFTYTVDDERFEIAGDELKLKADTSFNYEILRSVPVKVTVKDSANAEFTQEFTVTVTDSMGVQSVLDALSAPETYAFESKFEADASAVSYSGQTARQVLLLELNNYIGNGLQADVDADKFANAAAVKEKLMSFYAKSAEDWQSDIDNGTELEITSITVQHL